MALITRRPPGWLKAGCEAASRPAAVGTAAAAPATGTAASGKGAVGKVAAGKVAAGKVATETAASAGKGGGGAITVLAANMLYRDGSGVLTYTGNVHVDQDGKTLTCKQLDVNLDQDHKAKQMTCTGGTHLDDPAAGRKIDGETGVYRLETRKIDVFGNPVVMRDRDGNLVHGKRLRYAMEVFADCFPPRFRDKFYPIGYMEKCWSKYYGLRQKINQSVKEYTTKF